LGLFTVQLGSSVSLGAVNWASDNKFMQVEIDLGSGFVDIGTQQMLSVPYALYASSSGSSIPGPQGAQGPAGVTGPEGPEGNSGPQGIGIASITTSGNNFIITMTDGSTQITPIPNSASTSSGSNANTLIYTTSGF
jgi:hypothetical protein